MPPDELTPGLDKGLKRLNTTYVDLFFIHGVGNLNDIGAPVREWAAQMKKAGKIKFFGYSCHSNMEDCLLASAKSEWVDAVMFSYNFRLMHTPKMKEAVEACTSTGVGLIAMKSQGGGPAKAESEAEAAMMGKLLERGFSDKQAKLKAIWDSPAIASICSQMPNLSILSQTSRRQEISRNCPARISGSSNSLPGQTRGSYCAGCGRICGGRPAGWFP